MNMLGKTNYAFSKSFFNRALPNAQARAPARNLRGNYRIIVDSGEQRHYFRALTGSLASIQLSALENAINSRGDSRE